MDDMRNMILSELIDKMHGRMADKMFPDAAIEPKDMSTDEKPDAPVETHVEGVEVPADEDMSDDDIDEILKSC